MADVFYDVFISYSTQDSAFVTQLRLAIESTGRRVWQDVKELELTETWWGQIKRGIFSSDNFLFVVSPRSLSSPVCHLELEYARELKKRVIIVNHESADKEASTRGMVERILGQNTLKIVTAGRDMFGLAEVNWHAIEMEQNITIRQEADLDAKVPKLVEAFDKDLFYIRQGSILLGRGKEWEDSGKNASFLLLGDALTSAETWGKAGKKPTPTPLHLAYIQASRDGENEREHLKQEQERRIGRLRRASVIAGVIGAAAFVMAIIAGVLGVKAFNDMRQAEITQDITVELSNAILQEADNPAAQIARMDGVVEKYPDQGRVFQSRGLLHYRLKNYQLAIADLNHALDLEPNAAAYTTRGQAYAELQNYPSAIADYDRAIQADPDYLLAHLSRGIAYHLTGDYARAIPNFDRVIDLNPQHRAAYYSRANAYYNLSNYLQAAADYSRAIELNPNDANAYFGRGSAYYTLVRYAEARADYLRYQQITGRLEPVMERRLTEINAVLSP